MKKDDKVFEVLVEIIRNFMDNGDKNIQELEKSIVESLIAKGYVMEEINDLLDGVFNLMNLDNKEFTLRLLTEEEMPNFSDEGRAYLIYLKNNYILNEEEFERTIFELAFQNSFNGISDIKKYLVAKGLNPDVTFS
ncbi:MAG: DUF494 family protein [Fusobacteriaceae bacterium]|jgi:uncharacterized protein Smg (DUF494 family)|nr:DUF494 family protein [Fusobacteriaceae bacterium]MBP6466886.1 DUF494 family protein [Fusobacteriaceae bacterium]MBP9595938.1 DUF494 family protein [Fusobacteriaceae bacterium]MBU9918093.1 DUF494 domain-containing protein [Fusobacteriaceae bacterium]